MKRLTLFALFLAVQGQTSAPPSNISVVHFTALNCAGSHTLGYKPTFEVGNLGERRQQTQVQYNAAPTPLGFEGDLFLPPGFYTVTIHLDSNCWGSLSLPVLSKRNQDVMFVGLRGVVGVLRSGIAMIAGTAPFSGYSASIVYWPQDQQGQGPKTLVVHPARVQGDSYYATGLAPGNVTLRISTSRWIQSAGIQNRQNWERYAAVRNV